MKPVTSVLIKEKERCAPLPEMVRQKQKELYLPLGVWSAYSKSGAEGIKTLFKCTDRSLVQCHIVSLINDKTASQLSSGWPLTDHCIRLYFWPLSRQIRCWLLRWIPGRESSLWAILPQQPGLQSSPQPWKPVRHYECCSSVHLSKSSLVQIVPILIIIPSWSFPAPTGLALHCILILLWDSFTHQTTCVVLTLAQPCDFGLTTFPLWTSAFRL